MEIFLIIVAISAVFICTKIICGVSSYISIRKHIESIGGGCVESIERVAFGDRLGMKPKQIYHVFYVDKHDAHHEAYCKIWFSFTNFRIRVSFTEDLLIHQLSHVKK